MEPLVSTDLMREADAFTIEHETEDIELMRRAAEGIYLARKDVADPIAFICGSGNNGGDGFACALHHLDANHDVDIYFTKKPSSAASIHFYNQLLERGASLFLLKEETDEEKSFLTVSAFGAEGYANTSPLNLDRYQTIYDCLLGTGFTGMPRSTTALAISAINQARELNHAYVISADINSGLDGNTGQAQLAVESDLTVSIGFYKLGMIFPAANRFVSKVVNHDIDILLPAIPFKLVDPTEMTELRFSADALSVEIENNDFDYYAFVSLLNEARKSDRALFYDHSPRVLATPTNCFIERPFWLYG